MIAVEPTAAMVSGRPRRGRGELVHGVAEQLPLADDSTDVVWVSTALHHFADVDRSLDEFARVLSPKGQVMVRTFLPDRPSFTFLEEFPGRSKWMERIHCEDQLVGLLDGHGFGLVDVRDVVEWTETYAQSADWVLLMRNADSLLTALDDADIAEGVAAPLESGQSWPGGIDAARLRAALMQRTRTIRPNG